MWSHCQYLGVLGSPWESLKGFLGRLWGTQEVYEVSLGVLRESLETPRRSLGDPRSTLGGSWGCLGAVRDPWGPSGGPQDDPWGSLAAFEIIEKQWFCIVFEQLAGVGEVLGALSGSLVESGGSVRLLEVSGRRFGDIRGALG